MSKQHTFGLYKTAQKSKNEFQNLDEAVQNLMHM